MNGHCHVNGRAEGISERRRPQAADAGSAHAMSALAIVIGGESIADSAVEVLLDRVLVPIDEIDGSLDGVG